VCWTAWHRWQWTPVRQRTFHLLGLGN
jgi:hypothetical protein